MNVNGAKPNDDRSEGHAHSCSSPSPPFSVTVFVEGTPVPKPTQTQRDKWKKREVVAHYHAWCDRIRYAYLAQCGRMWQRVALGFTFYGRSTRLDLSNCVKAVEDALKGVAWVDDNVKRIPGYDYAWYAQLAKENEDRPEGVELRIRDLRRRRNDETAT